MYLIVFGWPSFGSYPEAILVSFQDKTNLPLIGIFVFKINIGALRIKLL